MMCFPSGLLTVFIIASFCVLTLLGLFFLVHLTNDVLPKGFSDSSFFCDFLTQHETRFLYRNETYQSFARPQQYSKALVSVKICPVCCLPLLESAAAFFFLIKSCMDNFNIRVSEGLLQKGSFLKDGAY